MKNAIRILAVLAILFVGCDDNEYEAPFPFSDVGFYTSKGTANDLQVNLNEYLSFTDLSQGAEAHSWRIEKTDVFLEGPIDRTDSILDPFIIEPRTTTSFEKTVHVLFQTSGMKKVRLYNTFNEMVVFKGNRDNVDYEMAAKKEGDLFVIDTTFMVKVYPKLVPVIKVRNGDVVVNHEARDTIYIEAGNTMEFTDLSTI